MILTQCDKGWRDELARRMTVRLDKYVGQVVTEAMKMQILADLLHEGIGFLAEQMEGK